MDGETQHSEWNDAVGIEFSVENKVTVQVRLKHDRNNLYFVFSFRENLEKALIFPEILIDPEHDMAMQLSSDVWWLHVSGTDCEARGKTGDYSNCLIQQPDWEGVPNYELSENPPPLEEIEIRVALEKLGIKTGQSFGMAVAVEYVPDLRASWPEEMDPKSPSTWATVVLGSE